MTLSRLVRSVALASLLVSGHALAQPPPGPMLEEEPNAVQSVLPNMLATSVGATIDGRLDFTYIGEGESDLTVFGLTAHGQYISPGGLGGYASIPFGYISDGDQSESGLGNLELGGLYAMRSPDSDILLRGGIALDSADDEDAFVVPLTQISPRLTDSLASGFATTWGRAQVQVRHASGNLRMGALGGFDVPIDGALEEASAFDGILNLAASLGFESPGFAMGFGLAYLQIVGSDEEADDDAQFGFNATIDFPIGPKARMFGALGIPDLDNFDENAGDLFALGVGVRATL